MHIQVSMPCGALARARQGRVSCPYGLSSRSLYSCRLEEEVGQKLQQK